MPRASSAVPVPQVAEMFSALGDPTRLTLVRRLSREGPRSITVLAEGSGVTRQAISRHLHELRDAGLVQDVKAGRERVYSLDVKRLETAQRYLAEVSAQWDAAAARPKAFVESGVEP